MAKIKLQPIQAKFLYDLSRMIIYAFEAGYELTEGRGYVSPEANRAEGGKEKSLHLVKLAHDFNLFKNGVLLRKTEDYKILGEWWKQQDFNYVWGGDFKKADGGHFARKYNGMA